jgi:hypothetical protein
MVNFAKCDSQANKNNSPLNIVNFAKCDSQAGRFIILFSFDLSGAIRNTNVISSRKNRNNIFFSIPHLASSSFAQNDLLKTW